MKNGRKIGAMLAALATFLLATSLLAPISTNYPTPRREKTRSGEAVNPLQATSPASSGSPATRSFSPPVINRFSWHPTPYVRRAGPPENYVETENLLVEPNYTLNNLDNVEIYDNSRGNKILIDTIPAYQVTKENGTFVKYRPPGKNTYLFTIENVRINGREPPFHTRNILDNPQVSFDVKLSNFGEKLKKTVANSNPSFLENYYITGFGNIGPGDVDKLSGLTNELEFLPIYQDGSLLENAKCSLSLTDQATSLSFGVSLDERNPGYASASGRLGSHSISWSVSSSTDWWDNSSTLVSEGNYDGNPVISHTELGSWAENSGLDSPTAHLSPSGDNIYLWFCGKDTGGTDPENDWNIGLAVSNDGGKTWDNKGPIWENTLIGYADPSVIRENGTWYMYMLKMPEGDSYWHYLSLYTSTDDYPEKRSDWTLSPHSPVIAIENVLSLQNMENPEVENYNNKIHLYVRTGSAGKITWWTADNYYDFTLRENVFPGREYMAGSTWVENGYLHYQSFSAGGSTPENIAEWKTDDGENFTQVQNDFVPQESWSSEALKDGATVVWNNVRRIFYDGDDVGSTAAERHTNADMGAYAMSSRGRRDLRTTINNGSLSLLCENMLGYWSMDEFPSGFGSTDNTVYDVTSLNHNGTAENGLNSDNIVSAKWDNALVFDGTDDLIDTNYNLNGEAREGVTISLWVKYDAIGDAIRNIFCSTASNEMQFRYNNAGGTDQLEWYTYDGNPHGIKYDPHDPSTGTWYHYTATFDNDAGYKLYINGDKVDENAGTTWATDTADELIAHRNNGGENAFDGVIDEVMIFNRALDENEVKRIYNRTKPSEIPNSDNLKVGTWASTVWDTRASHKQEVDNLEFTSLIGTGENLWANIGSDTDNDLTIEDNTGWVQLDGKGGTWSDPPVENGYRFRVEYKLATDNTTHSPSVQDWTLNVSKVTNATPTIRSVSVDNAVIDRDIDYSGSGAVDAVKITAKTRDNDGRDQLAMENALFTITDNAGTEIFSKKQAEDYENVDENTKDFTFTYNPSDSLPDDNLGSFDENTDVNDIVGAADNLKNAELFTVTDRVVENISFENDYEHVLKVTADSARVVGSASVTSATLTDNNLGDYDMGSDLAVSYKTTQDGKVTVKATDENIDGISSSKSYIFPNFHPSIESISVDNTLIDRSDDSDVFSSLDNATVTVTWSDPDNRTNDLTSEADALLSIRDNTNVAVLSKENIISSETSIDENTVEVSYEFNPSDSLGDENVGGFDVKFKGIDRYGMENTSDYTELGENLFTVTDLNTTLNISDTTPAKGDTITISGTASRVYGTVSLDNVMLEINGKLHQADFDNDNWSYQHTVQASGGSTVDVEVHLLDRGSSLDGYSSSTFTVRAPITPIAPIAPSKPRPVKMKVSVGRLKGRTFVPSKRVGVGQIATVRIKLTSRGEPVEGADVGAWWIPRPTQAKTETIEISEVGGGVYQGSFSIPEDVAPGTYEVTASAEKPGYEKAIGYDTFHVVRKVWKPGPVDKVLGWMRKHPGMVAVAIIALLLLVLIAGA